METSNRSDYTLIIPEKIDRLFYRDAIQLILKAGSHFLNEFKMPPNKIIFRGKQSEIIYNYIIEKKLNLNATFEFKKHHMNNEISIRSTNKVKQITNIGGHGRGESLNGVIVDGWVPVPPMNHGGLEITREKLVEPETTVELINIENL